MDYLSFWSKKMYEHALFISILSGDKQVQDKAEQFMTAWKGVVDYADENPNIVKDDPRFLSDVNLLLDQTEELKTILLDNPEKKSAILPRSKFDALLLHMIGELKYFRGVLNETLTPEEEEKFLAWENADHDKFLLESIRNPNDELLQAMDEILSHLSEQNKRPDGELKFWLKRSNNVANIVDQEIKSGELISIISEAMRQHEASEGEWEVQRYNYLVSMTF